MIFDLLQRARRRVIAQLLLDKSALALTIAMVFVILLLLVGTQLLAWYWPVLIALLSLSIGTYQLRSQIPSLYTLAQRMDERLHLADTLSTAVYFREHPKAGVEDVCEAQRNAAETTARGVSLEQALPYTRSRWLAPALGLLLVAAGLFAVRYAFVGSLDLSPSLVEMALDTFFQSAPDQAAKAGIRPDLRPQAFDPTQPPSETEQMEQFMEDSSELMEGEQQQKAGVGKGNLSEEENQEESGAKEEAGGSPKDKQGDKSGEPKEGEGKDADKEGEEGERNMFDKVRDAVSNLLNQMKGNEDKQEQQAQQKGDQKGKAGEKGEKGQKGEKGDSKGERAEGQPQQDSQQAKDRRDQEGEPGKAPGQPQEEAQAGAGQQDGKKDLEQAKMQEAMGKLSEILGQRSQQVSGEMMIEVGSTKQQLRTQYSDQRAGHAASGSEIHRDQIPLLYQPYVERYFEEIRKQPQSADTKAAPKGSIAPKGKG